MPSGKDKLKLNNHERELWNEEQADKIMASPIYTSHDRFDRTDAAMLLNLGSDQVRYVME
jgi:hypothetical protein